MSEGRRCGVGGGRGGGGERRQRGVRGQSTCSVCSAATTREARVSLRRHVGAASGNAVGLLSPHVRCLTGRNGASRRKVSRLLRVDTPASSAIQGARLKNKPCPCCVAFAEVAVVGDPGPNDVARTQACAPNDEQTEGCYYGPVRAPPAAPSSPGASHRRV